AAPSARAAAALPSKPADFPSGAIQFWVGFPAGGSTDVGGRILAAAMERILDQSVTVVNKVGGSGQTMWTELARTKPDASVIGMANVPQMQAYMIDPERQAAFNMDSFEPIANQVLDPGAVFVPTNSRFQTMQDLIQAAKQSPGQIRVGDTGIGSDDHFAILDLEQRTGADFRIVHFEGGTPLTTAVLGGQIDAAFDNVGGWVSRVKSGDGRVLGVMAETRSKFLPDVPTFEEMGIPIFSYSARGVIGPRSMKPDHVRYLSAVVEAAMNTADVQERMNEVGLAQEYMGPEEYAKFLQEQMQRTERLFDLIESERENA
ncbi:MAG: tripartite tricarboxylate transporter substrate binding protein, partial [Chloroflexota bacterium]|nr:tripartite tricarboxylate transporter substrate binding protein [Chloroflexota bacterium]